MNDLEVKTISIRPITNGFVVSYTTSGLDMGPREIFYSSAAELTRNAPALVALVLDEGRAE